MLQNEITGRNEGCLQVTLNGAPYETNLTKTILNVGLPIFTIHGNHDCPSAQFGKVSTCDLLQASNYVNYFGKHLDLHKIRVVPLIISKKGSKSQIALYGLGYIKDTILSDIFKEDKIVFEKPKGDSKDYFCLLVIHQNRHKKKGRVGVPLASSFNPKNIPEWMDLTIWGH